MVADCCYTLSITITRLIPFITVPTEHYLSTIWHYLAVGLQQRVVHSAEGATGVCRCAVVVPPLYTGPSSAVASPVSSPVAQRRASDTHMAME